MLVLRIKLHETNRGLLVRLLIQAKLPFAGFRSYVLKYMMWVCFVTDLSPSSNETFGSNVSWCSIPSCDLGIAFGS